VLNYAQSRHSRACHTLCVNVVAATTVAWLTYSFCDNMRTAAAHIEHCCLYTLPYCVLCRSKKLNVLLVFVPLAAVSAFVGWSDTVVFVLNFIAMVSIYLTYIATFT
jgi:hypothetical protein